MKTKTYVLAGRATNESEMAVRYIGGMADALFGLDGRGIDGVGRRIGVKLLSAARATAKGDEEWLTGTLGRFRALLGEFGWHHLRIVEPEVGEREIGLTDGERALSVSISPRGDVVLRVRK